ncbi:MAG: hypothetical protein ACRCX2_04630 [Paraclostridium sp.]
MRVKIWDRVFEVKVINQNFNLTQDMLIGAFRGIATCLEDFGTLDEYDDDHGIEVITRIVEKTFNTNIELVGPDDDCIVAEI